MFFTIRRHVHVPCTDDRTSESAGLCFCFQDASDTRVDVQGTSSRLSRFGWSCCCRLPSLGCRRVRITLLVADFPRNTSSREALRFPADAVDGPSGACLLLVTQHLSGFLHVTKQRLCVVRRVGVLVVYTHDQTGFTSVRSFVFCVSFSPP